MAKRVIKEIEKSIELGAIDPVDILGVNNNLLYKLMAGFPTLRVIARGSVIKAKGDQESVLTFEKAVNDLIATRMRKRKLSEDDIDETLFNVRDMMPVAAEGSDKKECDSTGNSDDEHIIGYANEGRTIKARTKNQVKFVEQYTKNDLLFAVGPAGTGKTYVAIALAVRALKNKEVRRIILTRPAVEAGEKLGFLPGDMKDKLDPYLQPLYDALIDMIPPQKLKSLMSDGTIQIAPLAYMRRRTLENAFVILDEAQNTSLSQIKMFLTRMGNNAKFIITGDTTQIDLPNKADSGLAKALELLKGIKGIATVQFTKEDIVRHPLVGRIVKAFEEKMLPMVLTLLLACMSLVPGWCQFMQGVEGGLAPRFKHHVEFLCNDTLMGRAAGSSGELAAAHYIYDKLVEYGVTPITPRNGDDFLLTANQLPGFEENVKDTIHSRNIVAIIEGTDPALKDEYILIGAHYDNVGVNTIDVNGKPRTEIFPGADANASGTAMLIELAREIECSRIMFRRSVIVAFFGAGCQNHAGSWYFLNRSFGQVGNITLMIDLNMVGRSMQSYASGSAANNEFSIFTGVVNWELNKIVDQIKEMGAVLEPKSISIDMQSDHRNFHSSGIPVVLITTGMHRDFMTTRDVPGKLDYQQMEGIAQFTYSLAQAVSERDQKLKSIKDQSYEPVASEDTRGHIYTQHEVDTPASYLHSDEIQFLEKWVYPYVKFPESALRNGDSGRVTAEFVIEKDGKVSNVKIVRGVSEDIDTEVVKVISASPKWKPAVLNREKVRVRTSVNVDFRLRKKGKFGLKK